VLRLEGDDAEEGFYIHAFLRGLFSASPRLRVKRFSFTMGAAEARSARIPRLGGTECPKGGMSLKNMVYCAVLAMLVACSPSRENTATTTQSGTSTSATTTTETAATSTQANATNATVPKAGDEEKPMSNYQDRVAVLHTSKGEIDIRFFPDVAPNHVRNFIDLAEKGFYNGTKFHRVIPKFMIQGGDPNTISGQPSTWGMGGSPRNVAAEFNGVHHVRGIVSMARSNDPNSASSQFFIMVAAYPSLDGQYTAFGQVTKGMDVADQIVAGKRDRNDRPDEPVAIESIKIRPATDAEKGPAPLHR
jgi:peptidyl-prolyl cis-trans isomerase B (cyclophilin B)